VLGPLWRGHWDAVVSVPAGTVLLFSSGLIALAGFLALGRNLTPHPKPRADATLVRHGIYGFIRHPLYCSLVLGCIGWGLVWQSGPAAGFAVVLALVLDAKARVEERWLREQFPEYSDYARRVRRFIPGIY
jgi:protein-S-isoprenylcysteine O-methyltransferase Ste14